jgi:hypothetical protein
VAQTTAFEAKAAGDLGSENMREMVSESNTNRPSRESTSG